MFSHIFAYETKGGLKLQKYYLSEKFKSLSANRRLFICRSFSHEVKRRRAEESACPAAFARAAKAAHARLFRLCRNRQYGGKAAVYAPQQSCGAARAVLSG